jgi:hypothetical protein
MEYFYSSPYQIQTHGWCITPNISVVPMTATSIAKSFHFLNWSYNEIITIQSASPLTLQFDSSKGRRITREKCRSRTASHAISIRMEVLPTKERTSTHSRKTWELENQIFVLKWARSPPQHEVRLLRDAIMSTSSDTRFCRHLKLGLNISVATDGSKADVRLHGWTLHTNAQ